MYKPINKCMPKNSYAFYIPRDIEKILRSIFKQYPVVIITGARQTGKSTLAKHAFAKKPYVNLEAPDIRTFVKNDPRGFFSQHPDGAILDEIQNTPMCCSYRTNSKYQ